MPSKKKGYKNKDENKNEIFKKKDNIPNHLKCLNNDYISNTIIKYYPILIPKDPQ